MKLLTEAQGSLFLGFWKQPLIFENFPHEQISGVVHIENPNCCSADRSPSHNTDASPPKMLVPSILTRMK